MSQPFREPNFTQFSNDALDYVMREVSPNAWKIISVAIRKTYGWHKEKDTISLSQFQDLTGIKNRSTVVKAINEALDDGILIREPSGMSYSYSLNRGYIIDKSDQSKKRTGTSPKNGPVTSPENGHTKESVKETFKEATTPNKNIFELYEENIGPLTQMTSEYLIECEEEYSEEWVREAIEIAVKANVRKWSYVEKILTRWKAEGKDDGLENRPAKSGKNGSGDQALIEALKSDLEKKEEAV
jgi:phage replication O-like protein O